MLPSDKVDLEETLVSLKSAIDTSKQLSDVVVLFAIPLRLSPNHALENIQILNAQFQCVASDMGVQYVSCDNHFYLKNGDINEGYPYDSVHLTLKGANKLAESLGLSAIDKQSGVCSFKPKHDLCYDNKDDIGVDLDHAFWIKVNNKTRNNHHQRQSNSPLGASKQPGTQPQSRPQFIPQGRGRQINPPPWVTRPRDQAAAMQPARGHHHQPQGQPHGGTYCHRPGGQPGGGGTHRHQRQAGHQTNTERLNMVSSQASSQQPCHNDIRTATPLGANRHPAAQRQQLQGNLPPRHSHLRNQRNHQADNRNLTMGRQPQHHPDSVYYHQDPSFSSRNYGHYTDSHSAYVPGGTYSRVLQNVDVNHTQTGQFCTYCGEENHRSSSCKYGQPLTCFLCKCDGHKTKFCDVAMK